MVGADTRFGYKRAVVYHPTCVHVVLYKNLICAKYNYVIRIDLKLGTQAGTVLKRR